MRRLLFLFLFTCAGTTYGQQHVAGTALNFADRMVRALNEKKYERYLSYLHPAELDKKGGRDSLLRQLKSSDLSVVRMNGRSASVLDMPGKVYIAGKELHCKIPITNVLQMPGEKITLRTALLAISGDGGKTWKFILTAGKNPDEVQGMVSEFNNELKWSNIDFGG